MGAFRSTVKGTEDNEPSIFDEEDMDDSDDDGSFANPLLQQQQSSKVEDRDAHVAMLNNNLKRWTGRGLFQHMFDDNHDNSSKSHHEWDDVHMSSRYAVMSHSSTNGLNGPVLNYANFGACGVFELSRGALLQFPAYCVAEPGWDQEEWSMTLQRLKEQGAKHKDNPTRQCIAGYAGWRCTLPGQRRFYVRDGVVWNCYDDSGEYAGQAILFDREKISYPDESQTDF